MNFDIKEKEKINSSIELFFGSLPIPNEQLNGLPSILIRKEKDLDALGKSNGLYAITTNEPINHTQKPNRKQIFIDGRRLTYLGISQKELKSRLKQHLCATTTSLNSGRSAMCVDLRLDFKTKKQFDSKQISAHWKCILSEFGRKKSLYLLNENKPITNIDDLLNIALSDEERDFLIDTKGYNVRKYFMLENGINVATPKHEKYDWVVHYLSDMQPSYLQEFERRYLQTYGVPPLNYYDGCR